jgi:hypothetical protein
MYRCTYVHMYIFRHDTMWMCKWKWKQMQMGFFSFICITWFKQRQFQPWTGAPTTQTTSFFLFGSTTNVRTYVTYMLHMLQTYMCFFSIWLNNICMYICYIHVTYVTDIHVFFSIWLNNICMYICYIHVTYVTFINMVLFLFGSITYICTYIHK